MAEHLEYRLFSRFQLGRVEQMGLIVVLDGERTQRLVGMLLMMVYTSLGKITILVSLGN